MRGRPVISIDNYTIYCIDADENKNRRGRKLRIVSAHAPTETAEDSSMEAFYDELNVLIPKIPREQSTYVNRRTPSSPPRLRGIIDAIGSRGRGNPSNAFRAAQAEDGTLKLQPDNIVKKNFPQSDTRKFRAVWNVAFDSDHRPVLQDTVPQEQSRSSSPTENQEDMPGDAPACLDKATPYGDRDDHPTRWFLCYRNTDSDTVARKEEDLIRDPDNYVVARK
ncbi:hypothetical protein RB195_018978 [Necator americanus]|uniref:Uncharacterized protein n=1 Tax=Necator americanus TaxID=51031 RepID=A0ABR1CD69_NECAM